MKITGLKVVADKGWKPDSTFTSEDGKVMPIAANHKIVCQDENGDIVNVTAVSPAPLPLKAGSPLGEVTLAGNVSHTAFGWSAKVLVTNLKG